jgi:hypothetical protein
MLIEVEKKVRQIVEVKLPYCGIDRFGHCAYINQEGTMIKLVGDSIQHWGKDDMFTNDEVVDFIATSKPCSTDEFHQRLTKRLDKIKEAVA